VTLDRFVDVGESARRGHDVKAVTVAEDAGHGDRSRELLKVLGGRVVGHPVDDDEGVSQRSPPASLAMPVVLYICLHAIHLGRRVREVRTGRQRC
jgi:hypothetical protein